MKKSVRISVFLAMVAVLCFTLVGCGASVDYVYSYDEENIIYTVSVNVPSSLRRAVEETAAERSNGDKWTLGAWLDEYMARFGFSYEMQGLSDGVQVYKYKRSIPRSELENTGDDEEEDENYSYTAKNRFFVYYVTVTMSNPFNGARESYDLSQSGDNTMESIVRYGYKDVNPFTGETVTVLPSLFDAFPSINERDIGNMMLNFSMPAPGAGGTTGTTVNIDGYRYYRFERKFDESDEVISYSYYAPCSLGWYVTAIVVGGIVVFAIIFATRTKKPKEIKKDEDLFPYDPEYKSGDGSNLPSGYNGGSFGG